jgi:hypothetical protein
MQTKYTNREILWKYTPFLRKGCGKRIHTCYFMIYLLLLTVYHGVNAIAILGESYSRKKGK